MSFDLICILSVIVCWLISLEWRIEASEKRARSERMRRARSLSDD